MRLSETCFVISLGGEEKKAHKKILEIDPMGMEHVDNKVAIFYSDSCLIILQ